MISLGEESRCSDSVDDFLLGVCPAYLCETFHGCWVWNVVHTNELLQCGFEGRFNEVLWLGRAEDSSPPITDDVCVLVEVVARAGELRGESLVFLCVDG